MNALYSKCMFPIIAVLGLGACATNGLSDADRLAMIQAHSGAPVKQMRYFNAMGWDRVDDDHVLLNMRPSETWLLRVSGPCLDWGSGSPVLGLSSQGPYVMAKLDRIHVNGSPVSCRIEEIRPVDTKALRAAESSARNQVSGGG